MSDQPKPREFVHNILRRLEPALEVPVRSHQGSCNPDSGCDASCRDAFNFENDISGIVALVVERDAVIGAEIDSLKAQLAALAEENNGSLMAANSLGDELRKRSAQLAEAKAQIYKQESRIDALKGFLVATRHEINEAVKDAKAQVADRETRESMSGRELIEILAQRCKAEGRPPTDTALIMKLRDMLDIQDALIAKRGKL